MKRIQAKNGFMLVKTGIEESGLPFIVITRAISGPDNSDFLIGKNYQNKKP